MKRSFVTIIFATLLLPATDGQASSVESMSLEVFKNEDQRYWEVSVACVDSSVSWSMQRPIDSDQWCTTTMPKQCGDNKFNLSAQVCDDLVGDTMPDTQKNVAIAKNSTQSKSVVKEAKANPDRYELLREQMQIEQQRIQIQQRRLALQRKELQLKRQQLGN